MTFLDLDEIEARAREEQPGEVFSGRLVLELVARLRAHEAATSGGTGSGAGPLALEFAEEPTCSCEQARSLQRQLDAWRRAFAHALERARAIDNGDEPMGADARGRRDYAFGYLQGVVGSFADGNVPFPREVP